MTRRLFLERPLSLKKYPKIIVLEIRHNPELVDLFPVELVEELIGCMLDVLARGDTAADHKDIRTGFEGVLYDLDPDAAGGCNEELASGCLLHRSDIAPCVGGLLGVDGPVELDDVRLHFELLDELRRVLHVEHIDDRVDTYLAGFRNRLLDGGGRGKAGDDNRIGSGVGRHPGFEVAGVEDLEVRDNKRVRAQLPDLADDAEAELLDQRCSRLDDHVVVLRDFL